MIEPLLPPDVDLRDHSWLMVDVQRVLASETWLTGSAEARCAAMTLWLAAWHQVPAGSMPENNQALAALSRSGNAWRRIREHALRGWVTCSDGRLYHPVVSARALECWIARLEQRRGGAIGNAKQGRAAPDVASIDERISKARQCLQKLDPTSRTLRQPKKPREIAPAETVTASPTRTPPVSLPVAPTDTHPTTQDKGKGKEEEKAVPLPSGSGMPEASMVHDSSTKFIFTTGVELLTDAGSSDQDARKILGMLRQRHGEAALLEALKFSQEIHPSSPIDWLMKTVPAMAKKAAPVNSPRRLDAPAQRDSYGEV